VRRREFIMLVGGTAAWPLTARAQHMATPVIGFLSTRSPAESESVVAASRHGLKDNGYVKGESIAIEYLWADGQYKGLRNLAKELVSRQVAKKLGLNIPSTLRVFADVSAFNLR